MPNGPLSRGEHDLLRMPLLPRVGPQHADAAGSLSATKMSPLGATRMMRGPLKPEANRLTSKPVGTAGVRRPMQSRTLLRPIARDPVAAGPPA